jgi:uncharacterized protein YggU (UPF0235/DUF167 family)
MPVPSLVAPMAEQENIETLKLRNRHLEIQLAAKTKELDAKSKENEELTCLLNKVLQPHSPNKRQKLI